MAVKMKAGGFTCAHIHNLVFRKYKQYLTFIGNCSEVRNV